VANRNAGTTRVPNLLVHGQGFFCVAFLFAVGINTSGLGLSSDAQCHAAIRVCIFLYGAAKVMLYAVKLNTQVLR